MISAEREIRVELRSEMILWLERVNERSLSGGVEFIRVEFFDPVHRFGQRNCNNTEN